MLIFVATNAEEWYQLNNRDAVLVDLVLKKRRKLGDVPKHAESEYVESIELKPATLESRV